MNQATELAIQATKDYILALNSLGDWYGYDFDEISYAKTAAEEILKLLKNSRLTPLDTLENFRNKMGRFSFKNEKTSEAFAVAYVTAENIIDILIS